MAKLVSADHLIGESIWTRRTRKRIRQVAGYRSNVLIVGPSGTGKELVARALHAHSPRAAKPFIPVNCAAIPGPLFASQLFGHVKGAFTGAQHAALGCFRAAEGGTLFLDEIGELDLDLQAKLLRVLQDREVVPVGGHEPVPVDVRIVAATNRDLEEEVRAGRFRLDLYYRLNVIVVDTESLASRVEDIEPLSTNFLAKMALESGLPHKRLHPEALALLQVYDWPGNVRELQNVLERAMLFCEDDIIGASAFQHLLKPARLNHGHATGAEHRVDPARPRLPNDRPAPRLADPFGAGESEDLASDGSQTRQWLTLAEMEAEHIRRTLEETFHNQSAAARLLDVDRKLLARKIKKYGLLDSGSSRRGRPTKNRAYDPVEAEK